MSKPTLFISSSNKAVDVARALGSNLDHEADIVIWSDQIFSENQSSLDLLLRSLDKIDYAILIITHDDLISQRSVSATTLRDNVIFELGIFLGRLGPARTFIVTDDYDSPIPLPSYLASIAVVRFRRRDDGNLSASLSAAFSIIRDSISAGIHKEHPARPQEVMEQYSCFISYSAQDRAFAQRIYNDLQEVGIRCWLDSKDLKIGDNIEVHVSRAIQLTDKVLLILSEASVNSAWVGHEIAVALRKESEMNQTILFPIRIDDAAMMTSPDQQSALLVRLKHIGDFTDWHVPERYRSAFSRLVKDLTVSAAAEQDRKL
jgi:TIR domain/Predicted nucleotide-binding protein containing TIR-like domain